MIKAIRGTRDILPGEARKWQRIEEIARSIFQVFGYKEIRTPIIEETALFVKSVGEETDIVTKEMFSFVDRGERNISLRPEGTAPIVRAYLENNLDKTDPFQKLYYIGPMFRAERPQAGRMRQFYQIGLEAIGSTNPAIDAEVIAVAMKILDSCGVGNYRLKINNLGCRDDKKKLSAALKSALSDKKALLCEDCRRRIGTNPLRVLDCKNENCRKVVRGSFKEIKFLCDRCVSYFDEVTRLLGLLKIPYELDPYIVRGLDYYTGTVFEVVQNDLGAQNAIGAGGRYDYLISDMGGPECGACGFALGLDRMVMALGDRGAAAEEKRQAAGLFVAAIGKAAAEKAVLVASDMRNAGIPCEMDYESKSLKSQMRSADKMGAGFVLIIGDEELAKGEAALRDMSTKEQTNIRLDNKLTEEIIKKLKV